MQDLKQQLGELGFAGDDMVVPFQVDALDVRGRTVQLGPLLDAILSRHDYPEPVARLLAEVVVLTALIGTSLKFTGKFTVQTKSDGPVDLLVADFSTPDALRGYARFSEETLEAAVAAGKAAPEDLLGRGVLAFTIDQGSFMQPYQGIVELDGSSLEQIAMGYFRQSEQIPRQSGSALPSCLIATMKASRANAGARAAWWRSSSPRRRGACASPICTAATGMTARCLMPPMTHGRKRRRWSRRSISTR